MTERRRRAPAAARRAEILAAARAEFLARGYGGATLAAIVGRAGGSRRAVYEGFGGKAGLFAAIVEDVRGRMEGPLDAGGPPETALRAFARAYAAQLMLPENLALYRLVAGETARFPELGAAVYRSGPAAAADRLARALAEWTAAGLLSVADPPGAARILLAAVLGDLHTRALFDPAWTPAPGEVDACADAAVTLFLVGCGCEGVRASDRAQHEGGWMPGPAQPREQQPPLGAATRSSA